MRVVFRVDASLEIGTGHLMRCMTLADELRRRGTTATFLCRELPGHLIELTRSRGFETETIAHEDASPAQVTRLRPDWVVVDHYGLGSAWESAIWPTAITTATCCWTRTSMMAWSNAMPAGSPRTAAS